MDLHVGDLDPDDLVRSFDIRTRAFGALPDAARPRWERDVLSAIDERRMVAAYDGGVLVGRALIRPFSQYWGGQSMPMAGIAGVVVSPEYRARGVGTALMTGTAQRARELGYPVSVLYPATVPVYRRTGWEIAGVQPRISIATRLLRELRGDDVAVREAGPSDAEQLLAIMRRQHLTDRACGPRDYTPQELVEDLEDSSVFAYVASDGFVLYGWEGSALVVHQLVAADPATARALWAVVGSSSSVADRVQAYVAPDDPIHQLLGECVLQETNLTRWMLRVIDLQAAVTSRGYPPGLQLDVPLALDDPLLPANTWAGRLQVRDGRGSLHPDETVRAAPETVHLRSRGLAAMYAGTSMATLRTAGLVQGGTPVELGLLDTAFVGRPAYLLEYF